MEAPLVSIIVPTYNRAELLSLTLESIKSQTFQNFEVIVVDDGSPNEKAKEICSLFSKVRYFKIGNTGGPSKPRNIGIKKAKGKYIAFVDDDDLWLPEKLEKQVAILEKYPSFGLVHGSCEVIDEEGKKTGQIIGRPGSLDVKHGDVKLRMAGNWTLMMPTVLIRKKVLDHVGYFNESMYPAGEDTEFWTRCSFRTTFFYMEEPLALYRKHQSNSKILKRKYIELPIYLKRVIDDAIYESLINKYEYSVLKAYIVNQQIKAIKLGRIKTLQNLFKLDPIWFLKFGNLKLLIKVVIFR